MVSRIKVMAETLSIGLFDKGKNDDYTVRNELWMNKMTYGRKFNLCRVVFWEATSRQLQLRPGELLAMAHVTARLGHLGGVLAQSLERLAARVSTSTILAALPRP